MRGCGGGAWQAPGCRNLEAPQRRCRAGSQVRDIPGSATGCWSARPRKLPGDELKRLGTEMWYRREVTQDGSMDSGVSTALLWLDHPCCGQERLADLGKGRRRL